MCRGSKTKQAMRSKVSRSNAIAEVVVWM